MKLLRSLPLALGSVTAIAFSFQEGTQQEGPPAARPPQEAPERRGLQPPADELPPGVGNRDVGALDVFGRRIRAPRDTMVDRIKGGWTLTEMELENSNSAGRTTTGFLHVGENYLSLEVHAFWDGEDKASEYDLHSSFTAEYNLDATGRLTCRTMLGGYLDERTGQLLWERAGFPREYEVSETDRELVLRWGSNANRLVFRPRPPLMRGQVDIFGRRQIVEPGEASLDSDIFGRKKPDAGGARDIFGRIVPLEKEEGASGEGGGAQETGSVDPRKTPPGGGGGGR